MDINVLKTFIAVCECGGFTAAAESLGYSQSTVSSQIKQLENELDAVLFDRIRHNTTVTAQGQIVLEYTRQIMKTYEQMAAALHHPEEITGEIHLAMASSICSRYFTDDYHEFHRRYPGISLKITSAGTEQMFDMLRKNEADIVFTLDAHIYDSEFVICAESEEQTHFVAAADHPLLQNIDGKESRPLLIKDLLTQDFYLTEPGMSYRNLLDLELASRTMKITPIMEVGNPNQICRLLRNSTALSFLPEHVSSRYVQEGSLAYLPVEDIHITVWNQILIHRNKWVSPAMQALIDFYQEVIQAGKCRH